ncbi:MAG TPA: hypothetical protein VFE11_17220, partial [Dongiaceae bacterium]|nr:hypothetical protein [Dongiaceae bacterium]
MTQSTQRRRQKATAAPEQKAAAAPKRKAAAAPKGKVAAAPKGKVAAAPKQKAAATAKQAAPGLTGEQLGELLALIKGADSVELKLSIPDAARRSAVAALEMDPLEAQMRQVVFFDT